MEITGKDVVDAICRRLDEENIRCYDSAIVSRLGRLSAEQLAQLASFGEVIDWHNDRITKAEQP